MLQGGGSGRREKERFMNTRPCALLALAFICGGGGATGATDLARGSPVVAVGTAEVRAAPTPQATLLGSNADGMLGRIVEGPVTADGGVWWRIDFEGIVDGWTTADRLATPYFPPAEANGGWRRLVTPNVTPSGAAKTAIRARAGLDWDLLSRAAAYSARFTSNSALLVIRNGWVAGEWGLNTARGVASVSKSLTGLVALKTFDLASAGSLPSVLQPDAPVHGLLPPSWGEADPRRLAITVDHLMTMTSGLQPDDRPTQSNYLNVVLGQPVLVAPETAWSYASLPVDLLGVALQTATGVSVRDMFNTLIARPLGVTPIAWTSFSGFTRASSGASVSPRDLARVGYLVLMHGAWDSGTGPSQVISETSLTLLGRVGPCGLLPTFVATPDSPFLVPSTSPEFYGHLWWTNRLGQGLGPAVPADAVYARGLRENLLVVVPSLNLVVVRLGDAPTTVADFPRQLMSLIVAALTGPPAVLAVPAVTGLTLIDADSDRPVALCDPLPNDAMLDFAWLPTSRLNLRADTTLALVGSVQFGLDATPRYRVETAPPYALAGDNHGDFTPWTPTTGVHTVTATPLTLPGGSGVAGLALERQLTVRDGRLATDARAAAR